MASVFIIFILRKTMLCDSAVAFITGYVKQFLALRKCIHAKSLYAFTSKIKNETCKQLCLGAKAGLLQCNAIHGDRRRPNKGFEIATYCIDAVRTCC